MKIGPVDPEIIVLREIFKKYTTRNAWQCPLGAVVSPLANNIETRLLIAALPSSPPHTERTWSHTRKIFEANCISSYVLNSGVTEPNLTKFLEDVEKWLRRDDKCLWFITRFWCYINLSVCMYDVEYSLFMIFAVFVVWLLS